MICDCIKRENKPKQPSRKATVAAPKRTSPLPAKASTVKAAVGTDEVNAVTERNGGIYSFFYLAPALIVVSTDRNELCPAADCAVALENMFLKAEQLGLSISEEKLRERIDVTTVNDTEVISVSVSDTSPKQAQDIANTIADVLPDEFERVVKAGGVEVVDYAEEPDRPSSPNVLLNTFAGVLAGFLISCGIVFLREFFDTRVRDEEGLSEYFNYEIPVLGVIPSLEETAEDRNPKRSRQRNEKR